MPRTPSLARSLAAVAAATLLAAGLLVGGPSPATAGGARQDVIVHLRPATAATAATAASAAADVAADHAARYGAAVRFVYRHAVTGYAASVPVARLDDLRRDPAVEAVERDQIVRANAVPWNLDRIDQRYLPLDGRYWPNGSGSGVTAYIVDTGIDVFHQEFGGRAVNGYDAVDGGTAADCNGHGTHMAGTVGSASYGVAKSVRLVAVRVLNCSGSGTTSQIVAGLDWVIGNHVAGRPAVANLSLGGGANTTLDSAVRRVIADGVSVSVAAGGSASDACNYSPARVAEAMTTGATDQYDNASSSTNTGPCVDWYAPGVNIISTWPGGGTRILSGSSSSAAHTTGAAALYLQRAPTASPATVQAAIRAATTKNVVRPTTLPNNDLVYVG